MFIGIDLGTSGVKLILVTKEGKVIKTETESYKLIIPKPTWTEQDPNIWYEKTIKGLKKLIRGYESKIEGISFSGQMHGLVILDESDKVLRNAILWNDQRTIEEVNYLNNKIGIDILLKETGNIALTGLTAPKLLWVKNNEPKIFNKIAKIMLPKDFISYKLTGIFASDVSDISGTLYFDVENRKYSQKMLEILHINQLQLPQIFESYEVIGNLKSELKNLLHITQDVKVIIGGGDQAVGAIGTGITNNGDCSISLGTSGVVFVASDSFKIDDKSHLQSYAHSNGKYHLMGVMLNAGGALRWWTKSIFGNYNYDVFFKQLQETNPNDDLYFLPYLTGERSPINDPYARGVFIGLRLEHKKANMDRAVIEGISFALRDTFELIKSLGVNITKIRITGGGAKSDIWIQMLSNIMNVEIETIKIEEGPALGAAILAMVGCKTYKNVEEACSKVVTIDKLYKPILDLVKLYDRKYKYFDNIYPIIKPLFKKLD